MAGPALNLPKSLLTPEHKEWLQTALKVLDNLQFHIDTATRAEIPGMDEHQKNHDESRHKVLKMLNTYFPNG